MKVSISTVHALDVDGFGRLAASGTTPDKGKSDTTSGHCGLVTPPQIARYLI